MHLPRLYKTTKTGATQIADISVESNTYTITFGKLDGKMQSKTTTCKAKNVGKTNETTPAQQAILEAKAKHLLKIKSGYSLTIEKAPQVKLPQKVKVYQDQIKNVKFPCWSTPKYNGVNATYWLIDDKLKLTSRGGEEYPPIPHLESWIRDLMKWLKTDCLNGELYIHGEHLQDITSAVKKPKELSAKLQFILFEMPNLEGTYHFKAQRLRFLSGDPMQYVTSCPYTYSMVFSCQGLIARPELMETHEDIEKHYNECTDQGYEGTVIYNTDAQYQFNVRSSDVFKYKKTLDAEYKIVDCESDKNGHPVFHCITPEDKIFKVKPKGSDAERKQILIDFRDKYLNNWYKIEYETLSKDSKPLKPVGIGLRDCDSEGNPKE